MPMVLIKLNSIPNETLISKAQKLALTKEREQTVYVSGVALPQSG